MYFGSEEFIKRCCFLNTIDYNSNNKELLKNLNLVQNQKIISTTESNLKISFDTRRIFICFSREAGITTFKKNYLKICFERKKASKLSSNLIESSL